MELLQSLTIGTRVFVGQVMIHHQADFKETNLQWRIDQCFRDKVCLLQLKIPVLLIIQSQIHWEQ